MKAVLVMGVAGSGKTTLSQALAGFLVRPFVEGDDLHDGSARAKMAAGEPLTDVDRAPWLDRIAARLARGDGPVVACSALKRAYRDRLRQAAPFALIYCAISPEEAARRLALRAGHFFPASLLPSQLATLEPPELDEGAFIVDAALPPGASAQAAAQALGLAGP